MFKEEIKKQRLSEIKDYRERGGTFSEIANLMNKKGKLTIFGKEWTENYLYRFFTENQNQLIK